MDGFGPRRGWRCRLRVGSAGVTSCVWLRFSWTECAARRQREGERIGWGRAPEDMGEAPSGVLGRRASVLSTCFGVPLT